MVNVESPFEGQGEAIDDDVQGCLGFFLGPPSVRSFRFLFENAFKGEIEGFGLIMGDCEKSRRMGCRQAHYSV
jgi:hypothetical protein